MEKPTRTFAAFTIDPSVKEEIGRLSREAAATPEGRELRWVKPEVMHLTVRFFGDLDRKQVARARTAISGLDGAWEAPSLRLGHIGAFPSLRRAQVVWLGLEDEKEGALAALAAQADHAIRVSGFGPADKPFVGHITLARTPRGGGRAPELTAWAARLTVPQTAFTIRTITLFESDLRPEGPVYTPLAIAHPRVPGEGTAGDRDRSDPANEP